MIISKVLSFLILICMDSLKKLPPIIKRKKKSELFLKSLFVK